MSLLGRIVSGQTEVSWASQGFSIGQISMASALKLEVQMTSSFGIPDSVLHFVERDRDRVTGSCPFPGRNYRQVAETSARRTSFTLVASRRNCIVRIPHQLRSISYHANPCRAAVGYA